MQARTKHVFERVCVCDPAHLSLLSAQMFSLWCSLPVLTPPSHSPSPPGGLSPACRQAAEPGRGHAGSCLASELRVGFELKVLEVEINPSLSPSPSLRQPSSPPLLHPPTPPTRWVSAATTSFMCAGRKGRRGGTGKEGGGA